MNNSDIRSPGCKTHKIQSGWATALISPAGTSIRLYNALQPPNGVAGSGTLIDYVIMCRRSESVYVRSESFRCVRVCWVCVCVRAGEVRVCMWDLCGPHRGWGSFYVTLILGAWDVSLTATQIYWDIVLDGRKDYMWFTSWAKTGEMGGTSQYSISVKISHFKDNGF